MFFFSFHCIICLGNNEHSIFLIDILQWGYYEHHGHNRLKQDAHITPVEGESGHKPDGVQKILNHFIIVPYLAG